MTEPTDEEGDIMAALAADVAPRVSFVAAEGESKGLMFGLTGGKAGVEQASATFQHHAGEHTWVKRNAVVTQV